MSARKRLNLAVTPAVHEQMNALQEMSGAESTTELIRRALAAYDFILQSQNNGGTFVLKGADGKREAVRFLF